MRFGAIILAFALGAGPLPAQQTETLADIRQDLTALFYEVQRLRTELSTTGATDVAVSGSTLDRVNAIEAELQRLTSQTEELQFRIGQVVADGSNRIGDLEFRLCELEPDCDIANLSGTPTLGGRTAPASVPAPQPTDSGTELAVGEETDFARAQEALAAGDFQSAADQFAAFREAYPGGPLEAAALVGQGRALEGVGDARSAARVYLDAYSGYPDAAVASEALYRLGMTLAEIGSVPEACATLAEVSVRFPGAPEVADAQVARSSLGCS